MIIDTDSIKLAVQTIINNANRAKAIDKLQKINHIKTYGNKILASVDAAAAIAPAVAALHKHHLRFITKYYTNSIEHQVGFARFNDNVVGCEGGGYSGQSVYIDVTDKMFIIGCTKYASLDELAEKYYDDWNVRDKFEKIAKKLIDFVEFVANDIQAHA